MRRTLTIAVAALVGAATLTAGPGASGAPTVGGDPVDTALAALAARGPAVAAAAGETFTADRTVVDADGARHVRFTRTRHGLRVLGGDVTVHLAPGGAVKGTTSDLARPLTAAATPRVTAAAAARASTRAFKGTIQSTGTPSLIIDATRDALAWETVVSGYAPDGQTPSRLHVLTDATTGTTYSSFDEIETIIGTGRAIYSGTVPVDTTLSGTTYQMIDPSHGSNKTCDMHNTTSGACTLFTDADNIWGNSTLSDRASAAADAHFASAATYDYFKFVHGQAGRTGSGAGITSRVHYGNNYANAFYDGTQLSLGDGSGNAHPLTAIDVVGHELGHGYTDSLVPLVYSGESGGISEASANIWATMVEFYAAAPGDPADYTIGEEVDLYGTGVPVSYLYDPALDGTSQSCYNALTTPTADPHVSSGIGGHFYFDLAEGTGLTPYGYSPICGSALPVTGIGRAKAEKIWYRALKIYSTTTTRYANMRANTLAAAADLYGMCSIEYKTVHAAWNAVNVVAADPCGPTIAAPGSMLWLRADLGTTIVGGKVSFWTDQSGTGHYASQTTDLYRPIYVAGALNGKPVVRFSNNQVMDLVTVTAKAFTIFVVGKNSNPNETPSPILGPAGSNPNNQLRWENGSKALFYGGGAGLPVITSTIGDTRANHILTVRYDGSAVTFWRDGILTSSTPATGTSPWSVNSLGSYYTSLYMMGDLAEVLVYPSAQTETDRINTNTYLKTKYALP